MLFNRQRQYAASMKASPAARYEMGDTKYKRRIALFAVVIAFCLSFIGFFLPSNLRWFTWGVAAGLLLLLGIVVVTSALKDDAPLRPEDVRRRIQRQSRFLRIISAATVITGYALLFFVLHLPDKVQAFANGAIVGMLVLVAIPLGPALIAAHRASVLRRKRIVYPTEQRPDA
jgi:putative Mn2+ efflux pump MntP